MAQLISLFLLFAHAQTLELLNQQSFDPEFMFQEVKMGGISGFDYKNGNLWAISDDRGSRGPFRMYRFDLKSSKNQKKWTVALQEMISLGDASGYKVLDTEAIHQFDDGRFLISSEGDLNKKPREMPMVRFWSFEKKWEEEISLPKSVYPEKTGMQTKGIHNNAGFEAMAVHPSGKNVWLMAEYPLFQNKEGQIEIFEMALDKKKWKNTKSYKYTRDKPPEGTAEVLRGMSEALWWKEDHLLVLERWLRITEPKELKGIDPAGMKVVAAELFSVKFVEGKVEKKKLLELHNDLGANWEALAWGPELSDGKRLLIIGSDNNFAGKTPTRFLFYSFKE